jgi:NAD(P)-dependent dehydrogenase (short-subunit alcohol dehydrogenase family)
MRTALVTGATSGIGAAAAAALARGGRRAASNEACPAARPI